MGQEVLVALVPLTETQYLDGETANIIAVQNVGSNLLFEIQLGKIKKMILQVLEVKRKKPMFARVHYG